MADSVGEEVEERETSFSGRDVLLCRNWENGDTGESALAEGRVEIDWGKGFRSVEGLNGGNVICGVPWA